MRSEALSHSSLPFGLPVEPICETPSPAIDRRGLILGAGTCLARFGRDGGLALEADRDRVLTLLSIAAGRAMPAEVLAPLAIASEHWRRGDRALANLRLVFARLPRLTTAADAANVRDAADLLDNGLSPHALMKALGFDAVALDKFNPGQLRVPAGSGPTSGRWTDGSGADAAEGPRTPALRPRLIPVAAGGLLQPGGLIVIPHSGIDPLDPQNLNTPLGPAEQQSIADTMNIILAGKPLDLATLNPHLYSNDPNKVTGAQLPQGGSYTTHYVRSPGAAPGMARILTEAGGSVYYTNNHYKSFYPVDIVRKSHDGSGREENN